MNKFFSFTFFAFETSWRRLAVAERREAIEEFLGVVDMKKIEIRSYSTAGFKADVEFFLWVTADDLSHIHDLGMDLRNTKLFSYMRIPYHYLSMTKPSKYSEPHEHEQEPPAPGASNYLFVYPFVKTRRWYELPLEERRKMMAEHIAIGHKFPSIRINTSYSYGIDDQDFVLAFEGDEPAQFVNLVQQLRDSRASSFTERDTPMFVGAKMALKDILYRLSFKEAGVKAVG